MKLLKKTIIGSIALVGLGTVLFGSNLVPYTQTAYEKVVNSANDAVSVSFQIDAAKRQLKTIDPEINSMYQQISKETVQIKRLEAQLAEQKRDLDKSRNEMLTLRKHLSSGKEFFVATNSKAYTTERVKEDLRHRFSIHRTAEQRYITAEKTLEVRRQALSTAYESLEKAQALKRELAVQIETLTARNRMNELVKTTNSYDFDDSNLARTRSLVDSISARIETDEEMLNMAPAVYGQIPVSKDAVGVEGDILSELDEYFNGQSTDDDSQAEVSEDDNFVMAR